MFVSSLALRTIQDNKWINLDLWWIDVLQVDRPCKQAAAQRTAFRQLFSVGFFIA